CYACLYEEHAEGMEDCRSNGILAPVVGVIGSLQAVEAMKLLTGLGEPLIGRILIYNALTGDWRSVKLKREPDCPVCSQHKQA
ncbi:MAG: ThiF family adenylyltransferase, partial [Gammaproteobacteria bacterium]|nr:ThiF family adenylyltransferase [Gammaproteobacteria bacterium]